MATAPVLVNVVFMGDSITFGQYVDSKLRWSQLVVDRLTQKYLDTPVSIHALNKGISGETTRQGLERFPADVQAHRPDVMTLQFGHNDCNCWLTDGGAPRVSQAAFRANLIEMIDRARRFGAKHIILSSSHPTLRHKVMLDGRTYEASSVLYSDIVADVARTTGVTFCDIRKAFSGFSPRELDRMLLPYPDHLHLSLEGNQVYAEAIHPLVEAAVADVVAQRSR